MYDIFLKLLEERGVKAADVAKATGIPQSTFSDWKSGRSVPKADKLEKIADYFNVSPQYLRTGESPKMYHAKRNPVRVLLELFKTVSPDMILDSNSTQIMNLIDKFNELTDDDKAEILNTIDFKLSRYKEKEKQDLA